MKKKTAKKTAAKKQAKGHEFKASYLLEELCLPYDCDGGEILSDKIVDTTRWSKIHELVFRLDDQPDGEAWMVSYSQGLTEFQDESPWESEDIVYAVKVVKKEVTVTKWVKQ